MIAKSSSHRHPDLSWPGRAGELAVATLAYAAGVALVTLCIVPTILTPVPLAAFLGDPPPVVARTPVLETRP